MEPVEVMAASPLFAGIGAAALKHMAGAFVRESWPKGREIANPQECARRFRLIVNGRVKITRANPVDGREITLWLLGPGDGFDIVSLLDAEPHAVAASALDDVETLAVALPVFERWVEHSEPLRVAMHRYVAHQLRAITDLASDLALYDTMTRLARLLLRHFDTGASEQGARVNLIRNLPQSELAALIGSVRVVVGRLVTALKHERVVELRDGRLHVLDLKRLLRRAEAASRRVGHDTRGRTAT